LKNSVVEAKNLTKKYGDFIAVDNIDFNVIKGECFGFLGPNGAGKTTTMHMLFGLSPTTEGELNIFGLDVKRDIRKIKEKLGVVPQEDNLDPDLSVYKNLLVYARYFDIPGKIAKERAKESLELFQLWEKRDGRIRELSGGLKRRLIIARALLNRPELLILDEPTTGLDPQARHLVWQKLRHLRREGTTMILTTHYMDEAAQLCDRLVIMDKGKILDTGSPGELIKKHVPGNVMELRGTTEFKAKIIEQIDGSAKIEDVGDTIYLYTEDTEKTKEKLDLQEADQVIRRTAGLEDVFLKLAGRSLKE